MSGDFVVGHGRSALGGDVVDELRVCTCEASIELQAVTVRVWEFADAPEEYRALAVDKDLDWLIHVPPQRVGRLCCVPYLEHGPHAGVPLGGCTVSVHDLPDGGKVFMGARPVS